MDKLPVELLTDILALVPACTRKKARLTCRAFNAILVRDQAFDVLVSFLDPRVALATCEVAVSDLSRRPRSIWAPSCPVPKCVPLPEGFLLALYVGIAREQWKAGTATGGAALGGISVMSLCELGREDVTYENIMQACFRYSLYLSYNSQIEGRSSYLHVLRTAFGEQWV